MKILFQGDSITDVGRNTNNGSLISIGQGYALLVSAYLSAKYPEKFEFVNRGISGNRVVDVYSRIKYDGWNENPDVLSILIGVNDVWHEFGSRNGVNPRRFRNVYSMLVSDTLIESPNTKMMILEPFVLPGRATVDDGDKWEKFSSMTCENARIAREVASEYGQIFVPLQDMLNKACEKAPAEYWLGDGVHPTPAGHQLIADEWIKAFEANFVK